MIKFKRRSSPNKAPNTTDNTPTEQTEEKQGEDNGAMPREETQEELTTKNTAIDQNVEISASGSICFTDRPHDENDEAQQPDASLVTPSSDLKKPKKIAIVTTAGLPWRTGTAVNPLLRALALLRDGHPSVTLLVPWLPNRQQRVALYGMPLDDGPKEQEAWIREYCVSRGGGSSSHNNDDDENNNQQSNDAASRLGIRFWQGSYNAAFGSIFPTEDLCALISTDEADVVILEEPEHLNWFRVPSSSNNNKSQTTSVSDNNNNRIPKAEKESTPQEVDNKGEEKNENDSSDQQQEQINNDATTLAPAEGSPDDNIADEIRILGWARKFPHVIGVLHTNYGAYVRQYNMAASFVTARALDALSAMCIRAYCHVVIRLSPTLPNLLQQPLLERTCNVHGVGSVFLEQDGDTATKSKDDEENDWGDKPHRVYFIGKIIWAKGFDKVLEVQEQYKAHTGHYFGMDIYGKGDDSEAIQRAFYGRRRNQDNSGTSDKTSLPQVPVLTPTNSSAEVFEHRGSLRDQVVETQISQDEEDEETTTPTTTANEAAEKDGDNSNLDQTLDSKETTSTDENSDSLDKDQEIANSNSEDSVSNDKHKTGIRLQAPPIPDVLGKLTEQSVQSGAETADAAIKLVESVLNGGIGAVMSKCTGHGNYAAVPDEAEADGKNKNKEELKVTTATTDGESSPKNETATSKSVEAPRSPKSPVFPSISAMASWSPRSGSTTPTHSNHNNALHQLIPARSRFKWRKNPIPATFWGVKDHAELRHTRGSCVFLNMSTTEVLCTTSAEALAMGKFVILPKHPSNEFFFDFPNCLPYESLEECVEQLLYAHANDPKPLSAEHRRALSWEGATERLYEAAAITKGQMKQREKLGLYKEQQKAARTHIDMARKSQFVSELFSGKMVLKRFGSSASSVSSDGNSSSSVNNGTKKTEEEAAKDAPDETIRELQSAADSFSIS